MPKLPEQVLSQRLVDSLQCPSGQSSLTRVDAKVPGLRLKVYPSGRKTWWLRKPDTWGKTVDQLLGDARLLSLSEARAQALERWSALTNPSQRSVTLKAFVYDQYLPFVRSDKRSWKTDEVLLQRHVLPFLGGLPLGEVTHAQWHQCLLQHRRQYKASSTNRLLALCRYLYSCALRWAVPGVSKNALTGITRFKEAAFRERYLSSEEIQRLLKAADLQVRSPWMRPMIELLLLTGMRRGELLRARKKEVCLKRRSWTLPLTKSGKQRHLPLSERAWVVLNEQMASHPHPWVFCNPKTGQPFTNINRAWEKIRLKAGLKEVRLHDLRHTAATALMSTGEHDLLEARLLLGHSSLNMTLRYAHVQPHKLQGAVNTIDRYVQGHSALDSLRPQPDSKTLEQVRQQQRARRLLQEAGWQDEELAGLFAQQGSDSPSEAKK